MKLILCLFTFMFSCGIFAHGQAVSVQDTTLDCQYARFEFDLYLALQMGDLSMLSMYVEDTVSVDIVLDGDTVSYVVPGGAALDMVEMYFSVFERGTVAEVYSTYDVPVMTYFVLLYSEDNIALLTMRMNSKVFDIRLE